jgi:hypothetical protein
MSASEEIDQNFPDTVEINWDEEIFQIGDPVALFDNPQVQGEVIGDRFDGSELLIEWENGSGATWERARDLEMYS